ncbi:Nitrogen permease regulator 2 [Vanrija albida]|uniref:Nitrogen permease regulator 2 n=1 Tax=Vanrija albida TaxID=181172 RepID=A0ABR3Q266_9TREE
MRSGSDEWVLADSQLFYTDFDTVAGPQVRHQVPENLITSPGQDVAPSRSVSRSRSRPRSGSLRHGSPVRPAQRAQPKLLNFASIAEFVIPKPPLFGKLVTCRAPGAWDVGDEGQRNEFEFDERGRPEWDASNRRGKHEYRIIGLASVLGEETRKYDRNQYIWNLCFVFRATARLEAFEPVVRKVARILRSAEIESEYLSNPKPEHTPTLAVLEQLFEDLNSYSETSIPLDGFNTLELKLFPFYPNPSDVTDWDVPVALVNINALKDDNWDITAARVAQHINGINHSARIAQLADADPALVRETLRHMLFYQVIMMVDIFQYSNMYAVTPAFPRLTSDETVMQECGPYVTRAGSPVLDWPILAALYTKLTPGTTVHQWCEANGIIAKGIDPRRFTSFGIIKGFLRRVQRWPVIVDRTAPLLLGSGLGPGPSTLAVGAAAQGGLGPHVSHEPSKRRVGFQHSAGQSRGGDSAFSRAQTLAGDSQFTLRSTGSATSMQLGASPSGSTVGIAPRTPPSVVARSPGRKLGRADTMGRSITSAADTHPSISSRRTNGNGTLRSGGGAAMSSFHSIAAARARDGGRQFEREDELIGYLDGSHHADEIQVRMGMSWAQLENVLGLDELDDGVGSKGVAVVYR